MEERSDYVELVYPGEEKRAVEYLWGDGYRNIWTIATLRKYGAFNLGLPEQGSFYGYFADLEHLEGPALLQQPGFLEVPRRGGGGPRGPRRGGAGGRPGARLSHR